MMGVLYPLRGKNSIAKARIDASDYVSYHYTPMWDDKK